MAWVWQPNFPGSLSPWHDLGPWEPAVLRSTLSPWVLSICASICWVPQLLFTARRGRCPCALWVSAWAGQKLPGLIPHHQAPSLKLCPYPAPARCGFRGYLRQGVLCAGCYLASSVPQPPIVEHLHPRPGCWGQCALDCLHAWGSEPTAAPVPIWELPGGGRAHAGAVKGTRDKGTGSAPDCPWQK